MADRPIIFSAAMIRALIDGRKTQTRRVVRLPQWAVEISDIGDDGYTLWCVSRESGWVVPAMPQHLPHDRLWCRETCRAVEHENGTDAVEYLADGGVACIANTIEAADRWGQLFHYGKRGPDRANREGAKVPAIHMPRWASRMTLVVTDVRVQRLIDISNEDARAEGAPHWWRGLPKIERAPTTTATGMFRSLWRSIHGQDAWEENPWVVALTFDVHRCNIDRMEEA